MRDLTVTYETSVEIQGHLETLIIAVQAIGDRLFIHAEVCGFDLTNIHYGYFKSTTPRNTRLRAESSRVAEMADVAIGYAECIEKYKDTIYIKPQTVEARISGTKVCTGMSEICSYFAACSIHSIESGETISWYEHDVYKQGTIELEFYRDKDGAPRFKAHDRDLYDFDKLNKLYNSEDFQNSNYVFFFYNEVRRLLNKPIKGHPKRMSGLMASDRSE